MTKIEPLSSVPVGTYFRYLSRIGRIVQNKGEGAPVLVSMRRGDGHIAVYLHPSTQVEVAQIPKDIPMHIWNQTERRGRAGDFWESPSELRAHILHQPRVRR